MSLDIKPSKSKRVVAAKPAPSIAKSKRLVFVVEDQPDFCEGLVKLINAEKDLMVCGKAGDGEKASKDISRLKPDLTVSRSASLGA